MKLLKALIIVSFLAVTLIGCGGGNQQAKPAKPSFEELYEPDWYGTGQNDPNFVYTYGQATKMNKSMALDVARANAQHEAAEYVSNRVEGMMKNFMEEVGAGDDSKIHALSQKVTRVVAQARFQNAFVSKRKVIRNAQGKYEAFVQYSIPKEAVNKHTVDAIKKEKELYERFRASQAFGELDKALE